MTLQPNQIIRTALSQQLKVFEKFIIVNYILKSIQGFGIQEVDRLFTTCLDNATLFPDAWRYMAAFSCAVTPSAPVQAAVISQCSLMSAPRHLLELMLTNWTVRQAMRLYGITFVEANSIWTDTQLRLVVTWADNVTIPVNLHPAQQVSSIVQCLISWRQIPVPVNEYTLCLTGLGIDLRLSPLDSFFDLLCLYQQLYEAGTVSIRIERLFVPPVVAIPGLATPSPIQADRALCHMQLAPKYPDLANNGDEAVQRAQDTGLWAMRFPAHLPTSPKDTLHAFWIVCTKSGFVVERMHRLGTEVALACRWDDFVIVGATPHCLTVHIDGANHSVDCSGNKVAEFVNTWIASIHSSVAIMLGEYTSREGSRCPKAAVVQVHDERLPWVLVSSQFPTIPQTWVPRTHLEYLVDATRAAAATRASCQCGLRLQCGKWRPPEWTRPSCSCRDCRSIAIPTTRRPCLKCVADQSQMLSARPT
ncbi:hypothetical protein BCR44DRAFT_1257536 [Catenaria anguillulae PL171]|uniref:Uncharacterized protein n=1 Tax=Catenaria anguillulae PL171 TaxID=765915 RepID=A0A1Y2HBI5_9FUNG|nr:hypothetical protein BCR44DRAFT_1257536 [Catenaria anguillulae PL171]